MTEKWTIWHTISLLVILLAIVLIAWQISTEQVLLHWLLTLGALFLFALVAGHGTTGLFWFGWLINEQNRISLSRLQMFLWTFVILSTFMTAVSVNLKEGNYSTAAAITIPKEILAVMGISTASLVGSPLILKGKKERENESLLMKTFKVNTLNDLTPEQKGSAVGILQQNLQPKDAHLYELIRGEEISNKKRLDLTRLQNLLFTLILVGVYVVSLGYMLTSAIPISEFPQLGDSAVTLLAISHAGYLTGKAVDKTPHLNNVQY
jgi:hypothetical protein